MGKKWIKIKETGQLYLEKIIVSFDIPILFVCNDFENRKYLCLNVDEETGCTVIAETDNRTLISMLKNQITMESVFRNSSENKIIIAEYNCEKDEIVSIVQEAKKIDANLLPEKEAFLELSNEVISEYLLFLKKQLISVEVEDFCEKKTITVKQIKFNKYFSLNSENVIYHKNLKLEDTKKVYTCDINNSRKMIA